MSIRLKLLITLICSSLLAGCETASWSTIKYPAALLDPPTQVIKQRDDEPRFLVVVRYYQDTTPDAYPFAKQRFLQSDAARNVDTSGEFSLILNTNGGIDENAFDAFLIKSTYYGLLFASCLRDRLPNADILLEPVSIGRSKAGGFLEFSARNPIPASLVIDVAAHIDPDGQPATVAGFGSTFGTTFVPQISMRVAKGASPSTQGNVAAWLPFSGLLNAKPGWSKWDARSGATATQVDAFNSNETPGLWTAWKTHPDWKNYLSKSRPWTPNTSIIIPMKHLMDDGAKPPKLCELPSKIVKDAQFYLRETQTEKNRLKEYSNILSESFRNVGVDPNSLSESDILNIYSAELKLLTAIQTQSADLLLNGVWGEGVRQIMATEEAGGKAADGAMMRGFATAATVSAIYNASDMQADPMQMLQTQEKFEASANQSMNETNLATLRTRQASFAVSVEFGNAMEVIQASSQTELREKIARLYAQ